MKEQLPKFTLKSSNNTLNSSISLNNLFVVKNLTKETSELSIFFNSFNLT